MQVLAGWAYVWDPLSSFHFPVFFVVCNYKSMIFKVKITFININVKYKNWYYIREEIEITYNAGIQRQKLSIKIWCIFFPVYFLDLTLDNCIF